MKINTPTLFEAFREFIGLPGRTRVAELRNEDLAMFFFSTSNKKARAANAGRKERTNA